ncbi:MAG TPA: prepilin-type N-terminal cleavage/methylation domain-containing protein [Capsulimonadaceae bacterium]
MKKGFTLIELLVVIAIISILAAILFPVFATVREKARQTTCASNEKQLSMALLQYVQDSDELLPCGRVSCLNAYAGVGWAGQIYPYVKSTGAYVCPDNTTKPVAGKTLMSYAINANIGPSKSHSSTAKVVWTGLTAPGSTVLLCEAQGGQVIVTSYPEPATGDGSPAVNGAWGADDNEDIASGGCVYGPFDYDARATLVTGWLGRGGGNRNANSLAGGGAGKMGNQDGVHSKGSNYAFCDGHVKFLIGDQVSSGQNAVNATDAQGAHSTSNPKAAGTAGSDNPAFTGTFSGI